MDIEKEEVAQFNLSEKEKLRVDLKKDIETFLKNGGEITECPPVDMKKYGRKFTVKDF